MKEKETSRWPTPGTWVNGRIVLDAGSSVVLYREPTEGEIKEHIKELATRLPNNTDVRRLAEALTDGCSEAETIREQRRRGDEYDAYIKALRANPSVKSVHVYQKRFARIPTVTVWFWYGMLEDKPAINPIEMYNLGVLEFRESDAIKPKEKALDEVSGLMVSEDMSNKVDALKEAARIQRARAKLDKAAEQFTQNKFTGFLQYAVSKLPPVDLVEEDTHAVYITIAERIYTFIFEKSKAILGPKIIDTDINRLGYSEWKLYKATLRIKNLEEFYVWD